MAEVAKTLSIPKISKEELIRRYNHIKPIVTRGYDKYYVRELTEDELINHSYLWMVESKDFGKKVNMDSLLKIVDVKMIHSFSFSGFFKPSVEEILAQIPKKFVEDTVAFEIVYYTNCQNDMNFFYNETRNDFHVSIVRLYKKSENNGVPINMTKKEYANFQRFLKANARA